jgi:hypothetical protein
MAENYVGELSVKFVSEVIQVSDKVIRRSINVREEGLSFVDKDFYC